MPVCDKCGAHVYEGASFCPECGDPISESDYESGAVTNVIPVAELTFGYSSSRSYDSAVDIARRFPSYSTLGEDKDITHNVTLPVTEVQALLNLYDLVGDWKSCRLLVDGQKCSKRDLTYYGLGCYAERQRMGADPSYCWGTSTWLSLVGCKRLELTMRMLSVDTGFVTRERTTFRVNKSYILDHLRRKTMENRYCPLIRSIRWDKFVASLPDSLPVEGDQYWLHEPLWGDVDTARGVAPSARFFRQFYAGAIPEPLLSEIVELRNQEERSFEERKQEMLRYERELAEYNRSSDSFQTRSEPKASGCGTSLFLLITMVSAVLFLLSLVT